MGKRPGDVSKNKIGTGSCFTGNASPILQFFMDGGTGSTSPQLRSPPTPTHRNELTERRGTKREPQRANADREQRQTGPHVLLLIIITLIIKIKLILIIIDSRRHRRRTTNQHRFGLLHATYVCKHLYIHIYQSVSQSVGSLETGISRRPSQASWISDRVTR